MPDFSVEQPSTEASLERLHDAVSQLGELVRDAARKSVALETRIEALPGPKDIAVAVEAELERTVRDARDAIDARVGQLAGDLDTLERRLAEVGDALVPLEGLRTEIATVADQSSSFSEIRAAIADAVARIGSAAPAPSGPATAIPTGVDTDEILAGVRGALDTTVATIRADFEVLVRAEQEAAERRIDALGLRITNLSLSVGKALEDLVGHSARINERAQLLEGENAAILESVRNEVASAVTAAGEAVRLRTETLGEAMSARAAAFESSVAERVAALESNLIEQLRALSGHVGALPEDITTTLGEINRTLTAAGDLGGVQTAIEAVAEQIRAEQTRALEQMSERVADVAPSVARALADVREALGSSGMRASEEIASVRAEVGSTTQRTADLLEELRAPLIQMAEAAGGIEGSRAELSAAIAALDEHLVQRTAGVKTSITDRATRLENQLASLPSAEDVAAAVASQVGQTLAEGQRKADESSDAVRHDMNSVASNVNEIWIRVRSMAKGLEELGAASKEDAATLIALIEEMAQSEERSAARLAEAERRFVGAVRQIEHERDRVFIETLNEFLERLPRRERNRLGKRMRALNFSRRGKEEAPWEDTVEPLPPAAPVSAAEQRVTQVEQPSEPPPKKRTARKPAAKVAKPKTKTKTTQPKKEKTARLRAVETKTEPKPRKQRTGKPARRRVETPAESVEPLTVAPDLADAPETAPQAPIDPDQTS